jgi:hypothetical protein
MLDEAFPAVKGGTLRGDRDFAAPDFPRESIARLEAERIANFLRDSRLSLAGNGRGRHAACSLLKDITSKERGTTDEDPAVVGSERRADAKACSEGIADVLRHGPLPLAGHRQARYRATSLQIPALTRDPIHGSIVLTSDERRVVNSRAFNASGTSTSSKISSLRRSHHEHGVSEQAAILGAFVEKVRATGHACGETLLQKAAFVMKELFAVPLSDELRIHYYGPFSFQLRDRLSLLEAEEFLRVSPREASGSRNSASSSRRPSPGTSTRSTLPPRNSARSV